MLAEIFMLRAEAKARAARKHMEAKGFQPAVIANIRTPPVVAEAILQSGHTSAPRWRSPLTWAMILRPKMSKV